MNKDYKELKTFYIFLVGQFVSQFGSKMTSYGLTLWAYKQSGSVLSAALLSVCYLVPEVLFNFIAGSLSETWDKKRIMLIADGIAAILSCSILGMLLMGSMELEYLYMINFILGVADAFQSPASEVTVSLVVSKENYMKTSGLQSLFNAFTTIFYPLVATVLYAFSGLITILFIDLCTFLVAFFTLLIGVKIPKVISKQEAKESIWQKCLNGMRYFKHERGLLELIAFMAFVNFVAAIYNTNLAPMILARTENNDLQLGIVSGTIGVAGLVGSLLVSKVRESKRKIPLILNIMSFSFLVCNSMLGIGKNYHVWVVSVFLGNVLIPILTANVTYIMRTHVPIEMQGRVFSARNTLQYLTIPMGNLLGGILADDVFEPLMRRLSGKHRVIETLVGSGKGSGIALLYVVLGMAGFLGCCAFRKSKRLHLLDES